MPSAVMSHSRGGVQVTHQIREAVGRHGVFMRRTLAALREERFELVRSQISPARRKGDGIPLHYRCAPQPAASGDDVLRV